MNQKTRNYSSWRARQLADPERAARYLNAALNESKEAFFHALTNVIQAHQVSTIAKKAGVTRESLYRSFSATGNPKLDTIESVLSALDLKFGPIEKRSTKTVTAGPSGTNEPASATGIRKRRGRQRRKGGTNYMQLALPFSPNVATVLATATNVASPVVGVGVRVSGIELIASTDTHDVEFLPGFMRYQQRSAIAMPSYTY